MKTITKILYCLILPVFFLLAERLSAQDTVSTAWTKALDEWNRKEIINSIPAWVEINQGQDPDDLMNKAVLNGDYELFVMLDTMGIQPQYPKALLPNSVRAQNKEIVKYLLGKGFTVVGSDKFAFLAYAARWGDAEVFGLLAEELAGVEIKDENGMTPIMIAAEGGHLEIVSMLLQRGANINGPFDYEVNPPLVYAISRGHIDVVRLLLNNKAEIAYERRGNKYTSPLIYAVENGHLDITKLLIEKGCSPHRLKNDATSPLLAAVTNNHYEVARYLLEQNVEVDEYAGYKNRSHRPLNAAAIQGDTAMIRLLLDYGAKMTHSSAIREATVHGHREVLELLIEYIEKITEPETLAIEAINHDQNATLNFWLDHGVDVNTKKKWTEDNLLMIASSCGHPQPVKTLVQRGAGINDRNHRQMTPLLFAAMSNNPKVVKYLVDKGADLHAVDYKGDNALMHAAYKGADECIKVLLDAGLSVNCKNNRQRTPLMAALMERLNSDQYRMRPALKARVFETVKLLIEKGAEVNTRDYEGMTPLFLAVEGAFAAAAEVLLSHGADVNAINNAGDKIGVYFVPHQEDSERMAELLSIPLRPKKLFQHEKDYLLSLALQKADTNEIKKRLEEGANIQGYITMEDTPIGYALNAGHSVAILKFLVENGAPVNSYNYNRTTPLMRAVMANDYETASWFISEGADVNARNSYNNTPLIFAAKTGDVDMIRLLTSHGAKVNTTGNAGITPLSMARDSNHTEAVRLLLSLSATEPDNTLNEIDDGPDIPYDDKKEAAMRNNPELMKELIQKGVNPHSTDHRGNNVLMHAAFKGEDQCIKVLLDAGFPVDQRNKLQQTPLLIATLDRLDEMYGEEEFSTMKTRTYKTAKLLIEYGADVNAADYEGMTPFLSAVEGGYAATAELLIKNGADTKATNKAGDKAAVFFNIYHEDSEWMAKLLGIPLRPNRLTQQEKDEKLKQAVRENNLEGIRQALQEGADILGDPNIPNSSALATALHQYCPMETIKFLIENGAWIDTLYNTTALMRAVNDNDLENAAWFIQKGADVNVKGQYDDTCLIVAAGRGHTDMIRLLVNNGVDINATGYRQKRTPLKEARRYKHTEAVELLLSLGADDPDAEEE